MTFPIRKNFLMKTNNSKEVTELVLIFPGINDSAPHSNDVEKYETMAKIIAQRPDTAVVVMGYSSPHNWGNQIDFDILTNELKSTLGAALLELQNNKVSINLKNVKYVAHSYGFTIANVALHKEILSDMYLGKIDLLLVEPYGFAPMQFTKSNKLREPEVAAAFLELLPELNNTDKQQAAKSELQLLSQYLNRVGAILGEFRPTQSIHESYGKVIERVTALPGVGHGCNLASIEKYLSGPSDPKKQPFPGEIDGFKLLMATLLCYLSDLDLSNLEINKLVVDGFWDKRVLASNLQQATTYDRAFNFLPAFIANRIATHGKMAVAAVAVAAIAGIGASYLTKDKLTPKPDFS